MNLFFLLTGIEIVRSVSFLHRQDYKYHLHLQVAEREPVEEMKENRPKGVNEIQWAVLCGYWESDEGKKNAKQILKVEGSKLLTDT